MYMANTLLDSILEKKVDWNGADVIFRGDLERDVCKSYIYYRHHGIMFKSSKNSEKQNSDIKEEYLRQNELHSVDPEHTARPYALVLDDSGNSLKPIGYLMEFIDGVDLSDYMRDAKARNNRADSSIISQLEKTVSKFHSRGLYHGDIHENNIRVTNDHKIKMIDPYVWHNRSGEFCVNVDNDEVSVLAKMMLQDPAEAVSYPF